MKKILLILSILTIVSCRQEPEQTTKNSEPDLVQFSDTLEVTTNRRVTLLPEAKEEVSEWLAYATAQNEVEALRTSTGRDILDTANSIMQIMESLKTSMPDNLSTTAVNSRANVLLTKAKILHQLANKKEKNAGEIFEIANDLIVEFDNFKLQLNELFLKSPGDFEEELDDEFERIKEEALRGEQDSAEEKVDFDSLE